MFNEEYDCSIPCPSYKYPVRSKYRNHFKIEDEKLRRWTFKRVKLDHSHFNYLNFALMLEDDSFAVAL